MIVPTGFAAVTPYFFVDGAEAFVTFLVDGLGGTEVLRHLRPTDGRIANAQVRFGDATVMVSEASTDFPAMPCSTYLYVADVLATMTMALQAGATEAMPVADMPYGERQGGVRDRHGNLWWLAQRLVVGPYG